MPPAEAARGRPESIVDRPGYHSPQVEVAVRLNTNESPEGPPPEYLAELAETAAGLQLNRYPDRQAAALRGRLGERLGLSASRVFCANGSNEALLCLLLAFGGPGKSALVFEPTYALHRHIAELTGTTVVTGERGADWKIDRRAALARIEESRPALVFSCSPNNPTGNAEDEELLDALAEAAPGLFVIDEAYAEFSPFSALELLSRHENLVVVRTFSKTWALAGLRLGYLLAAPEVVEACERASLPYHLSSFTQAAGVLALDYQAEMEQRAARLAAERRRLGDELARLDLDLWPSHSNFILFRPRRRSGKEVWEGLLEASVLVRDVSSFPRLENCLRVTVGTTEENDAFLRALAQLL